jgi:hypothetical protein
MKSHFSGFLIHLIPDIHAIVPPNAYFKCCSFGYRPRSSPVNTQHHFIKRSSHDNPSIGACMLHRGIIRLALNESATRRISPTNGGSETSITHSRKLRFVPAPCSPPPSDATLSISISSNRANQNIDHRPLTTTDGHLLTTPTQPPLFQCFTPSHPLRSMQISTAKPRFSPFHCLLDATIAPLPLA